MPPLVWTESLSVRTDDLTPAGTVSLPALCGYLQEAAGPHAAALGVSMDDLAAEDKAWVLARLRLDVERPVRRGDTVTVETWPSGLDGLYTTREFVLTVDGTEVARATSAWFLIDLKRRRPVRPPQAVRTLNFPDRAPALAPLSDELSPPERADHERTVTVGYHDLDRNEHVNNVRYLTWALDTLPASVFATRRCTKGALDFRHEASLGDPVRAVVQTDAGGASLRARHAIVHAEDERMLAVAHTHWAPR
ncbi:MAG: acyl-[acyl-carrier-protein] thioesterase [Salinivenus sp.]